MCGYVQVCMCVGVQVYVCECMHNSMLYVGGNGVW